jgi:hypothetical protein
MSRHLVHALVVALSAGVALAEKPKDGETVKGRVKKVDPSAQQLIVTVDVEKAAQKDRTFDVIDSTKFVFTSGGKRKEVKGKAGFDHEALKEGATVTVVTDKAARVVEVRVGDPEKEKK